MFVCVALFTGCFSANIPTTIDANDNTGSNSNNGNTGSSSNEGNTDTGNTDNASYTELDASSGAKIYLDLISGHTVAAEENWHIAYQAFSGFSLNGGISGSGSVTGCLAQEYTALYDANSNVVATEFNTLTQANTLGDFLAIDASSCTSMVSDNFQIRIPQDDWLQACPPFSCGNFTLSPKFKALDEPSNGWIIRSAALNGSSEHEYARVRVAEVNYSSDPSTRQLKFAMEYWNTATQSFNAEEISSNYIDFTNGKAYWDLETNAQTTANDKWEFSIVRTDDREWMLQLNSGASGSGLTGIGQVRIGSGIAIDVTDPTDSSQVHPFLTDIAVGALSTPGDFGPLQYNVDGDLGLTPTFAHYLIHDGSHTFKVQIISNTGENNDKNSGSLYIRYDEL